MTIPNVNMHIHKTRKDYLKRMQKSLTLFYKEMHDELDFTKIINFISLEYTEKSK